LSTFLWIHIAKLKRTEPFECCVKEC